MNPKYEADEPEKVLRIGQFNFLAGEKIPKFKPTVLNIEGSRWGGVEKKKTTLNAWKERLGTFVSKKALFV